MVFERQEDKLHSADIKEKTTSDVIVVYNNNGYFKFENISAIRSHPEAEFKEESYGETFISVPDLLVVIEEMRISAKSALSTENEDAVRLFIAGYDWLMGQIEHGLDGSLARTLDTP